MPLGSSNHQVEPFGHRHDDDKFVVAESDADVHHLAESPATSVTTRAHVRAASFRGRHDLGAGLPLAVQGMHLNLSNNRKEGPLPLKLITKWT